MLVIGGNDINLIKPDRFISPPAEKTCTSSPLTAISLSSKGCFSNPKQNENLTIPKQTVNPVSWQLAANKM